MEDLKITREEIGLEYERKGLWDGREGKRDSFQGQH